MTEHLQSIRPVLELYGGLTGLGSPELDDAVISDLLADLRHWCDKHQWDYAALERRAYGHYMHEATEYSETRSGPVYS